VEWIQEAVVKEQALKMSDVFTFSSYWFCLFPEGLRRTGIIKYKIKDWNRGQERELPGRSA